MESRYINDIEIAKCQRDFELKKAVYDQEVNTKKAESDMAYSLQVNSMFSPFHPLSRSFWSCHQHGSVTL